MTDSSVPDPGAAPAVVPDPAAPPVAAADPPPVADPADKPADSQDKPADPVVPEEYAPFEMPEGVELDQAAMTRASPVFKELGLSQEQAQKLASVYATELTAAVQGAVTPERIAEYETALVAHRSQKWADEVKADPEIGGNHLDETHKLVQAGMAKFGSAKLSEVLNETGMGNHPELVRMFRNIGAASREDRGGLPAGAGGAVEKSLAERMYPNQGK